MGIPKSLLVPASELSCAATGVTPVSFDWSEGHGETWESIVPTSQGMKLAGIRQALEDAQVELPDPNPYEMDAGWLRLMLKDAGVDLEGHERSVASVLLQLVEENFEEDDEFLPEWREAYDRMNEEGDSFSPMMSYYYPLPCYRGDELEDQRKLSAHGGACILVSVNDDPVLALAGGGMDLSEDICLSYMLLGYLPPLHFCSMPRYAGTVLSDKYKWLLSGCIRTCDVTARQAQDQGKRLKEYRRELSAKKLAS